MKVKKLISERLRYFTNRNLGEHFCMEVFINNFIESCVSASGDVILLNRTQLAKHINARYSDPLKIVNLGGSSPDYDKYCVRHRIEINPKTGDIKEVISIRNEHDYISEVITNNKKKFLNYIKRNPVNKDSIMAECIDDIIVLLGDEIIPDLVTVAEFKSKYLSKDGELISGEGLDYIYKHCLEFDEVNGILYAIDYYKSIYANEYQERKRYIVDGVPYVIRKESMTESKKTDEVIDWLIRFGILK